MSISKERLRELEKAERKLNALEIGGVDNWEWYGEALKEYDREEDIKDSLTDLFHGIEQLFGESAYEPSESGAGIAFKDDVQEDVTDLIMSWYNDTKESES